MQARNHLPRAGKKRGFDLSILRIAFATGKSLPVAGIIRVFFCLVFLTGSISVADAAKYAGLVMDAKTGKILYQHRGDAKQYPASLTKMMTLYMMFDAIESGKMTMKTRIRVSKYAASKPPSKIGIKPGGTISAAQAIGVLTTKSANDIAAAVAEHLGGTESGFAVMMTRQARQLGMNSTTFKNASGLPNSKQLTTARDMARLGIALREHFPQHYGHFSKTSYKLGKRRYGNHNRLLGSVKGMDGIKTGYTRASGYNLVSSVRSNGRSIVAVVLGGKSGKSRNAQMVKLIKTYLPKASRGKGKLLLAKRGSSVFTLAKIELPETGPMPQFRNAVADPASQRVAVAHIISTDSARLANSNDGSFQISAIELKLRELGSKRMPVPTRAPSTERPDLIQTAAVSESNAGSSEISMLSAYTAPEPARRKVSAHRSGWQVQIGAVVGEDSAYRLLAEAREKAPKLLASLDDYTETTEKNGILLHRARFAGLDSKTAARNTCNQLKKKRIACLALQN